MIATRIRIRIIHVGYMLPCLQRATLVKCRCRDEALQTLGILGRTMALPF